MSSSSFGAPRAFGALAFAALASSALLTAAAPANAQTLIDVADTGVVGAINTLFSSPNEAAAQSWTQTVASSNVSVAAVVNTNFDTVSSARWWITTEIGLGASAADVVASGVYSPPPSSPLGFDDADYTTLATGLDFAAGTYYLVLGGVSSKALIGNQWDGGFPSELSITQAPGFTLGDEYFSSTSQAFAPKGAFDDVTTGTDFTGAVESLRLESVPTGVGGGAVPEPATWALMLTGFGLAGAGLRSRRQARGPLEKPGSQPGMLARPRAAPRPMKTRAALLAGAAAASVLGGSGVAAAATYDFAVTFNATGTLDGAAFTDQTLVMTGQATTTSPVETYAPTQVYNIALSSEGVTGALDSGSAFDVQFVHLGYAYSGGDVTSAGLSGYLYTIVGVGDLDALRGFDLSRSIGPLTSPVNYEASLIATTGGELELDTFQGDATFQETVTPTAGVPEPGTWALMLTGFGLAGAGLRSRRRAPDVIHDASPERPRSRGSRMKRSPLALGIAAVLMSASAQAAITVHTAAFITSPDASTGFESASGSTIPLNSTFSDGGVTITDVSQGPDRDGNQFIYTDYLPISGNRDWYDAGDPGYFAITRTGGQSFDSVQFSGFSGFETESAIYYDAYYQGVSVGTGVIASLEFPKTGTFGISGATFDEVRFQALAGGSGFNAGGVNALGIDDILIGNGSGAAVPEPAAWVMMLLGFGSAGAALRQQRRAVAA